MSSVEERISKLREERIAREKARIEKLRVFNLNKYSKNEPQPPLKRQTSNASTSSKLRSNTVVVQNTGTLKNNFHVKNTTKRPVSVPPMKTTLSEPKPSQIPQTNKRSPNKVTTSKIMMNKDLIKTNKPTEKVAVKERLTSIPRKSIVPKSDREEDMPLKEIKLTNIKPFIMNTDTKTFRKSVAPKFDKVESRKSIAPKIEKNDNRKSLAPKIEKIDSRKSMQSKLPQSTNRESVFDRLYKPKVVTKKPINQVEKIHNDPSYLQKHIKNTEMIVNRRQSLCEPKAKAQHVRRSISAVHFKRISKSELAKCNRKWTSIGEKLDKVHLTEVNEDEKIQQDKIVSAVKSERKKVQFATPSRLNMNTPRPEELQSRLQAWLQKRGKSLNSFHHLQCFGLQMERKIAPLNLLFDEENKENIALEHDSDNESYTDNVNDQNELNDKEMLNEWRGASLVSESEDLDETRDTNVTLASGEAATRHDELMVGALNDLTEVLREGFNWEQCARWLRAIRDRFPLAPEHASYWECRAALEERRGDLPASVQCWEEAIAMGSERSVAESNLDNLLDKFMQLKISPNSGSQKLVNPKMVDVKNVFKSTIIRFAVQQAKLRNSTASPIYTMTPVRRSGRLSVRTPLSERRALCPTVKQAEAMGAKLFVRNETLYAKP